jgi:hypothetical protein
MKGSIENKGITATGADGKTDKAYEIPKTDMRI